jgi:hypothetical protein
MTSRTAGQNSRANDPGAPKAPPYQEYRFVDDEAWLGGDVEDVGQHGAVGNDLCPRRLVYTERRLVDEVELGDPEEGGHVTLSSIQ